MATKAANCKRLSKHWIRYTKSLMTYLASVKFRFRRCTERCPVILDGSKVLMSMRTLLYLILLKKTSKYFTILLTIKMTWRMMTLPIILIESQCLQHSVIGKAIANSYWVEVFLGDA